MVFGGPYSNLEATRAILAEASARKIPSENIICTGDVVAYCADPSATVELIRASGCHVIMGNCEESLAAGAADCGCGFPEGSSCERLSAAWFSHAVSQLQADDLFWMAGLPRRIDINVGGVRLAVVHGDLERINGFVFASTLASANVRQLRAGGLDGVIAGHCGLPFTQMIGDRLWHNAGAIGMPANDGTPRGWFSLLSPTDAGISIEHRSLSYDHRAAAAKIRGVGLSGEYAGALESGLWPSCDVLPREEIRLRGIRLEGTSVTWQRPPTASRQPSGRTRRLWPSGDRNRVGKMGSGKFRDPRVTAAGEPRAVVPLERLTTLWFNTGTLCNIACRNCYIESTPRNDRLTYLSRQEVAAYLDEIEREKLGTEEIGFTGGEPFMNPDLLAMLEDSLSRGLRVLVLTNAMRPMQRLKRELSALHARLGRNLAIRVSLDHFQPARHEEERGRGTFAPALNGLIWLARTGFRVSVAGRTMWGEDERSQRAGYARLFAEHAIPLDADIPAELVLFPEMDAEADVPEISAACWQILGKSPSSPMCASSRMVAKRKGANGPVVVSCTLLPYEGQFELGSTLKEAAGEIPLNHPHCAKFCVLGGSSCSRSPSA